jgi:hypothetical protein
MAGVGESNKMDATQRKIKPDNALFIDMTRPPKCWMLLMKAVPFQGRFDWKDGE